MNNAYGKSEEYHPEKILEEQQRFEDRNIENSMRYAPQSTPTKRALSEDDRDDGEYENRRSMSEDDRDDGDERKYTHNEASGLSGVALLNVSNHDNQNEQGLQTRPQPVQLRLDKGSKSSRKRKQNQILKHPMLEPCKCKKNCADKFTETLRKDLHGKYWEMPYDKRQTWLCGQTTSRNNARVRVGRDETEGTK